MDIKVEKLPKSRVKITVRISPIAMGEYFSQALNRLAAETSLQGFRPGKAPLPLVEKIVGEEKINQKVLEITVPLTYLKAVEQEKLIPLQNPSVNIKEFGKGKALVYEAEVDVMPEVKLGDYRRLKIQNPKSKIQIKEQDIEEVLRRLQKQTADLKPVERLSQKGDFVEIDFESFLDNKPLPQGKSQNHPVVLGEGQFIPEFEEKLIGMKREEEKNFSIKFPSDFHNRELAGKEVSFKVRMKDIKEINLPKINDQWATKFGKKNLKDLKDAIKESLKKEEEQKQKEELRQKVIDKVVSLAEIELPETLVNAEVQRLFLNLVYQIESKGLKFEKYLEQIKKTEKDLIADLRKPAEQNVKTSLVLEEIKKKEGIEVSQKELEDEIKKLEGQKITVSEEDKKRIENFLGISKTVEKLVKIVSI
jgi:trigger factor